MKPAALVLFLVVSLGPLYASALTVEEAYAAIPHQRTVFDGTASRLSRTQVASLQQLFALSDKGTVLRVEAMRAVKAANLQEVRRAINDYRVLIGSVNALDVPAVNKAAFYDYLCALDFL